MGRVGAIPMPRPVLALATPYPFGFLIFNTHTHIRGADFVGFKWVWVFLSALHHTTGLFIAYILRSILKMFLVGDVSSYSTYAIVYT